MAKAAGRTSGARAKAAAPLAGRRARIERKTRETDIVLAIDLD